MFFLFKSSFKIAIFIVLLGVTALSLVLYGAQDQPMLDLLCHFRPYYLLLQIVCFILLLLLRSPIFSAAAVFCVLVNLLPIAPYYWPKLEGGTLPQKSLRILQVNLLSRNEKKQALIDLVKTEKPDIIAVEELTYAWAEKLQKGLNAQYPYRFLIPETSAFGIGVFSKVPLRNMRTVYLGKGYGFFKQHFPTLLAEFTYHQKPVSLIVAHPVPPIVSFQIRNSQLNDFALLRPALHRDLLLIGDLNDTPWSPTFQDLLSKTGLRDSQLGYGVQASWRSHIPGLQLPLDHILVSSRFKVRNRWLGATIWSDHLPVLADLSLD